MKAILDGLLIAAVIASPAYGGNIAYVASDTLTLRDCPGIVCHEKAVYPFGTELRLEGPVFTPPGLTNPWVKVSLPIRNPDLPAPYPTHVVGFVNALYLDFGK